MQVSLLYSFVRRWVMMSEAQRNLKASWSKYHCVAGTPPLPGVAILQIISCFCSMSVSLPCTSVCILFLLIYLDIYLPSFSTDAPFWTILPIHYCLFTLLLKFFTVLHSEQWRDKFSWLRVAARNKALGSSGISLLRQACSSNDPLLSFLWAYRNSWHGVI